MLTVEQIVDKFLIACFLKKLSNLNHDYCRKQVIDLDQEIVDGRLIVNRRMIRGLVDVSQLENEYGKEVIDGFRKDSKLQIRVMKIT